MIDRRFFAELVLSRDSSVTEFTLSNTRFFATLRMTEKAKCSLRMTWGKAQDDMRESSE
jgi:hypothetical protein